MIQSTILILITIGLFALIPFTYSLRIYWRIRIREYLSFSILWFSAIGSTLLNAFNWDGNELLYAQIHEMFKIGFTFMMFHTALRMNDFKSEKRLFQLSILGGLYSILLTSFVVQWNWIDQNNFDFFLPYLSLQSNLSGSGGGYLCNDVILYSEGYNFLRLIFGVIGSYLFVMIVFRAHLVHPVANVVKALNLWKISAIGIFLFHLGLFTSMFNDKFLMIGNFFGLVAIFNVSLIIILYPEGFLLTKLQILRISHLYHEIDKVKSKEKNFSFPFQDINDLVDYINQLKDIIESE